jgi:uncharacterized protein (TIGR00369 family)
MEAGLSEQQEAGYAVIMIREEVDRPVDHVWGVIGGFFDLDKWLGVPCAAQAGDGGIGSVRRIPRRDHRTDDRRDRIFLQLCPDRGADGTPIAIMAPSPPKRAGRKVRRSSTRLSMISRRWTTINVRRNARAARGAVRRRGRRDEKGGAGMTAGSQGHSETGLKLLRDIFAAGGFGQGIGRTLGLAGVSADPGVVVLAGDPTEDHQNPLGTVHGGYVATLLDGAMALALQTCLDPGTPYATTDLNINYLRAVPLNGGTVPRRRAGGRSRPVARACRGAPFWPGGRATRLCNGEFFSTSLTG